MKQSCPAQGMSPRLGILAANIVFWLYASHSYVILCRANRVYSR